MSSPRGRSTASLRTILVATILFLHLPVVALGVFSFSRARLSAAFDGPTLLWYGKLLSNRPLIRAMETSLVVAIGTTLVVVGLATLAALGLKKARPSLDFQAQNLFLWPLVTPEIVFGVALLLFFSRAGLGLGRATVLASHVVFTLPFAYFVIRARVETLPQDLNDAASDLGATTWQTLRRVTLPLLMPGILSAGLLTFSLSIDDYVVTSFVSGAGATTLPVYIYALLKSSLSPEIAAASTLMLATTTCLLIASGLFERRRREATLIAALGFALLLTPMVLARARTTGTRELNLYLWSNYITPETIAKFEARTGARVNLDVFDSSEALLSKLLAGNPGYDVVSPSTYILSPLLKAHALQSLDHDRLPHLSNTDPRFLGQDWDPRNQYSIPYLWGTTGIAWDSRKVKNADSWSVLFDPSYRNKILMLDDAREAVASVAFLSGADPNTVDSGALGVIQKRLSAQRDLVKAYNSASFDDAMLSGDVLLAQSWSGQIAKAMRAAPWMRFTIPREGAMMFMDTLAIPEGARDPGLAHEFLDFVMEAESAEEICRTTGYSTPSLVGRALLPPQYRNDPAMFPSDEEMKRLRTFRDLGEGARLYDRLWTEVKAGRE